MANGRLGWMPQINIISQKLVGDAFSRLSKILSFSDDTPAEKVASQLDADIPDEELSQIIKDVVDRRDRAANVCEAVIIVLFALLLYISSYVWLNYTSFKGLGIELPVSRGTTFVALVIGNAIWVARIGTFFKVLVLEALFEKLRKRLHNQRMVKQVLDSHLSNVLFSDAVEQSLQWGVVGSRLFWFTRTYARNGLVAVYSVYFYATLSYFIFVKCLGNQNGWRVWLMVSTLLFMNATSLWISSIFIRFPKLRPHPTP